MRGLSATKLAGFELLKLLRGRLTAMAVVVMAVIPLLYGALYLYAFWDPYGRLNHVPAAMVMEDQTATASDGTKVHAGQDLADELIEREVFDWHVTDEKGAEDGLRSGKYHMMLRIPRDFSANLVVNPEPKEAPRAAELRVVSDDATNYLSGVFSRTAFEEVRTAAAKKSASGYFDKMLIGFTDLKEETQKAADGAATLEDKVGDAKSGASKIAGGITSAHGGAGKIAGGLGTAANGADALADGLVQLRTGANQLADATRQTAAVGRQLSAIADAAVNKIEPVLRDNADLIQEAATQVGNGADLLAANVHKLDTAAADAVNRAEEIQRFLNGLPDEIPGIGDARAAAAKLVAAAKQVQQVVDSLDLDGLAKRLRVVSADARKLAAVAPNLADDAANARDQLDRFATALNQIEAGMKKQRDGTATAASGASDLRGGIFQLATGARHLDSGLGTLSSGQWQLTTGLGQIQGGAAKLANGLADGADQIPGFGKDTSDRADMLGDPVALNRTVRHAASTYGVGFAPYFLTLALWVGAMISYMVLKPLNRRYVMSGAPAYRVALAGLLPAVAIGLAQATILFTVVTAGLGLSSVHPATTLGLLMLTAVAFAAIMQLLGAALRSAGRIMALALLMVQLTSSGGTYPVQTTPGFFQAVHPWLPMTYVVQALRHTIDGGPAGTVTVGVLALLAFGIGSFALTVGVAHRSRRLTPSVLHPELVI
ncbi:YhgE/Pip family protein [Krasilnikovia sp. MM14-A1004]|uniref:YhgE/Pip family protein n=1 Tax=Krasilnikovia sp. MM14-A1004 TaxID=3373541 RepID=UPI00399D268E